MLVYQRVYTINVWLVVWNMNVIFPYIGNNHPNWRTPSFFRGVGIPPIRITVDKTWIRSGINPWRSVLSTYISSYKWNCPLQWWTFSGSGIPGIYGWSSLALWNPFFCRPLLVFWKRGIHRKNRNHRISTQCLVMFGFNLLKHLQIPQLPVFEVSQRYPLVN